MVIHSVMLHFYRCSVGPTWILGADQMVAQSSFPLFAFAPPEPQSWNWGFSPALSTFPTDCCLWAISRRSPWPSGRNHGLGTHPLNPRNLSAQAEKFYLNPKSYYKMLKNNFAQMPSSPISAMAAFQFFFYFLLLDESTVKYNQNKEI